MDQQWLTTLISKSAELRLKTQSHLQLKSQFIRSSLLVKLKEKGFNLSVEDLNRFIEENSPQKIKPLLTLLLDVMRPFSKGIHYRLARLSDLRIELIVPSSRRNLGSDGSLHEGVLMTASIEAALILWKRNCVFGPINMKITETQFQLHQKIYGDCRIRMEISDLQRESVLGQIRLLKESSVESNLFLYDEADQFVGEMNLKMKVYLLPVISLSAGG